MHPWGKRVYSSVIMRFATSYPDKGRVIDTFPFLLHICFGVWISLLPLQMWVNCLQCLFHIACHSTKVGVGQERELYIAEIRVIWLFPVANSKCFK